MALEVSPFLNEKKLILVALASVNPLRAMCSKERIVHLSGLGG
jgi:hypothetical protein